MGNITIRKGKKALESVEDTKEYHVILQDIGRAAGDEAVIEAKVLKIPITYLNDNYQIVTEFPDGKIEVIKQLVKPETSAILRKGTVLHARKG